MPPVKPIPQKASGGTNNPDELKRRQGEAIEEFNA
jgi:hypothetical protein